MYIYIYNVYIYNVYIYNVYIYTVYICTYIRATLELIGKKMHLNVPSYIPSASESRGGVLAPWLHTDSWLVVKPSPLKDKKVSWDYYSQLNGKIKVMVQTTNQL
jgi:hypothetical protein